MESAKTKIRFSFRTKVLVPVVIVMVLLMTVSMWLAYRRVHNQLQDEARNQLTQSGREFTYLQDIHGTEMEWRYRNIVNEPKFKALASLAESRTPATTGRTQRPVDTSAQKTLRGLIHELIRDKVADAIVLTTLDGQRLSATRDPLLTTQEFETHCTDSINLVLRGLPFKSDLALYGGKLFDIMSLPIIVDGDIRGAISFGVPNTLENDFHQLTHSEIILRANNQVIAYKLSNPDLRPEALRAELAAQAPVTDNPIEQHIRPITLFHERYLYLTVSLNSANSQLNYLVLYPIEKSMQALEETQRQILIVSLLAILIGTTIVSLIIHKAAAPLKQLRTSAEAIGGGDFSHHVTVKSHDEFGELAQGFNRMTTNLKNSRDQLESTVQRLKTTQAQLVQSEKLSGIGEFIAGIAHELNNPLTTVMGFSELLQQDGISPEHKTSVDMIFKNAQRCQKIVHSLLSFARRHQPERKSVCVNRLIEAALDILSYQLRTSNIEIITHLDPALPHAMVDSHQIQQVFVNIINNGRQAIEAHQTQGQIKITTETAGHNVHITIQDTGPGISDTNLSKIFDPFFTTKEVGQGTGLGLSLCYGIIQEHGGTIIPSSQPGKGATFTIDLPITYEIDSSATSTLKPPPSDKLEGVGKKILAIDDEEPILEMIREILTRQGYHVDTANNGKTGLTRLHQNQYDVILCDWKMPGLNGRQVYDELRQTNPTLASRLIFITGDLVSEKTRHFLDTEKILCLPKPFSMAEVRTAITKTLAT